MFTFIALIVDFPIALVAVLNEPLIETFFIINVDFPAIVAAPLAQSSKLVSSILTELSSFANIALLSSLNSHFLRLALLLLFT